MSLLTLLWTTVGSWCTEVKDKHRQGDTCNLKIMHGNFYCCSLAVDSDSICTCRNKLFLEISQFEHWSVYRNVDFSRLTFTHSAAVTMHKHWKLSRGCGGNTTNTGRVHVVSTEQLPTQVHKNGHNSTHDQYFFMKLASLDSAHIYRAIKPC